MMGVGLRPGEQRLMRGVLALAISLSEVIKDALKLDCLHRLKQNGMSEEEVERWENALMDLDQALGNIKGNLRVAASFRQEGPRFDRLIDHLLAVAQNPDPPPQGRAEGESGEEG